MSAGVEYPTVKVTPESAQVILHIGVDAELFQKVWEVDPALVEILRRRLSTAAEAICRSYI